MSEKFTRDELIRLMDQNDIKFGDKDVPIFLKWTKDRVLAMVQYEVRSKQEAALTGTTSTSRELSTSPEQQNSPQEQKK
jgi:hypothetical protein